MLHKVISGSIRPSAVFKCLPFGESVSAQAPTWRLLRGTVQFLACKVGRRIRQRGFFVGWCHLNLESTDLRGLHFDVRSGRVLGAVLCPVLCLLGHTVEMALCPILQDCSDCLGTETLSRLTFRVATNISSVSLTLIRDLQKYEIPWIFDSSSLVSCLAHSSDLLS